MSIAINGNFERDQYVASFTGQVNFVYTFPIYAETYLTVYQRGATDVPDDATQILTLGVDYSVTGVGAEAGGTIILTTGATFGDIITIVGTQPIERESVFSDLNPFTVALNQQLNQMTIMMQQNLTYWENITPHYNFNELISAPQGANPGVRPYKLILPMLGDGETWVGRGQLGSIPDDIIAVPLPTGGGGSGGTSEEITQTGQTFVKGNIVRIDEASGIYVLAQANSAKNAEVVGMVTASNVVTGVFTVQQSGYVPASENVVSGLVIGEPQYLSATAPGAMQNTDVTSEGQVSRPIFLPDSPTSGWILPYRGVLIGGASGGSSNNAPNNVAVVVQPGNGFTNDDLGKALYISADSTFMLANAYENLNTAQAEWVLTSILVANNTFTVQQGGQIQGLIIDDDMGVPIVSGAVYYLSPVVGQEGKLTPNEPTGVGEFSKPFYIQQIAATQTGWILDQRPIATNPPGPPFIVATGGIITTDGNRKIHTFLNNDTFQITSGSGTVDYLVIGGGGGGGANPTTTTAGAGGGGSGSLLLGTSGILTVGIFPVVIGAGGAGGANGTYNQGSNGSNSSWNGVTALGGGGGGSGGRINPIGLNGGSGGGAGGGGSLFNEPGGTGNVGGHNGGNTLTADGGAGGGGAGAIGGTSTSSPTAAAGGSGMASAISGTAIYYAGGGGGGAYTGGIRGGGGMGGGGMGGDNSNPPTAGTPNTGSGGGGAGNFIAGGAAGGSGIVILSYVYM